MSTIILLDVSLSMCRPARRKETRRDDPSQDPSINTSQELIEIKQLANAGVGTLLDYLAQNVQLERVALVVFSSLWEIKQEFTRNHETIKNQLYDLELYDKSNVVNAMRGIVQLIPKELSQSEVINIILVTDGHVHHGPSYSYTKPTDQFHDIPLSELEEIYNFPCKIQVVLLTPQLDPYMLKYSIDFYKKLIKSVDKTTPDSPVLSSSSTNKNLSQSGIWLPEVDNSGFDVTIEAVERIFLRIADHHYKPYRSILACGHLCSMILLSPKPSDYVMKPLKDDFDDLRLYNESAINSAKTFVEVGVKITVFELGEEINICGFLPASEVASPAVVSRHIVMPIYNEKFNETSKAEQILSQDPKAMNQNVLGDYNPLSTGPLQVEASKNNNSIPSIKTHIKTTNTPLSRSNKSRNPSNDHSTSSKNSTNEIPNSQDITKQPSFCMLLLNALKQENMVAICEVGKSNSSDVSWYGMLHAQTDSKKRTSLMLSLFLPSDRPILWLPNFKTMGSSLLIANLPEPLRDKMNATYNSKKHPKSYSTNNVLWLDPESVQADLMKVVRHARRSLDKVPLFYKELNRIRRAAISYGFYDVLFGLADILEREKNVMLLDATRPAIPEIIGHIEHAVKCLRASLDETSFTKNITALE